MARNSDWIDSTSELIWILRSTEVVLFCAVPKDQAANNVGGSQRGRSRASDDRTPAARPVPQHDSEARTPHSIALLCVPFAPSRSGIEALASGSEE